MKKAILTILCAIMIGLALPISARADAGPKPSVVIDFTGLEGEMYYATLLSSTYSTGPHSAGKEYQDYMGPYDIFLKFSDYQDADWYSFLPVFQDCSTEHRFSWTYYPPETFKVLLYFPETDSFIVSQESYECYAFDSFFTAEIAGPGGDSSAPTGITLSKSNQGADVMVSFVIRVLLTLAVELGIALLFGLSGRRLLSIIALTNIGTQFALNLVLNAITLRMHFSEFIKCYLLLELAVFAIEAIVYTALLKQEASKQKLIGYALLANTASFGLGLLLAALIPAIF